MCIASITLLLHWWVSLYDIIHITSFFPYLIVFLSLLTCTISPAFVVSDLDVTDDIALLSPNHEDTQALLNAVEQEALPVGLRTNYGKTSW